MFRRTVSGIMLTLLLTSMLTLAFKINIQPLKAEPSTLTVPYDSAAVQATINAASQEPPPTEWNKTYGGTPISPYNGGADCAWAVVQTGDGGYALAGWTSSRTGYTDQYDFWLVKTDPNGNMLWNQTYGGTSYDCACSMVQTGDGGYALAGYTNSYDNGVDAWLVKTDANGNMQWNKTYGETTHDRAYSVVQTGDGGYALAGFGFANLIKTDANGNILWTKSYGGVAYDLVQTADGGYALAGYTGYLDFWLVKTDASGTMFWSKSYGGTGEDCAYSLVQTGDGGYALAGYTESFGAGSWDFWLVKTDPNGDMLWNKTYGGTSYDCAYSVVQTGDGGYALAGYTESFGAGSWDFWLVKVAPQSSLSYTVTFSEHGLPPGAIWDVTFNGFTHSTSDSQIIFTEVNGQYQFSVTSTSELIASPISQGTINVETNINIVVTWGAVADVKGVLIDEVGLPPNTSWSVTYGCITNTTTRSYIAFLFFDNGVRHFSMRSIGYTAEPSPVDIPACSKTTNVIFIPDANIFALTNWDPCKNSYNESNTALSTPWSSGGNCYGLASSALLYFMHYSMGDSSCPYFPSQYPFVTSSTSDLNLGDKSELNNASLALIIHQLYDPQGFTSIMQKISNDNAKNFETLSSSLQNGVPVVMTLWNSKDWSLGGEHSVVAWGLGRLSNGSYAIAVYDPNYEETTQVAIYDKGSNTFSYAATGPYDNFLVINPKEMDTSWRFPTWWWPGNNWIDFAPITNYYIIIADKNVTVERGGSKDTFSEMGNSQAFVKGIPNSCGVEEGNMQAYAVPGKTVPKVHDPASNQSTIFISYIDNESSQITGCAYLLNASTTQGYLNYTLTPSNSGLSISAGDNALNATVTCFSATQKGYSVSNILTVQIDAGQSANITAPCAIGVTLSKNVVGRGYPVPINVTINNVGSNPENVTLTLCANTTAIDSEMVFNLLNGTSVNLVCFGNTSSCAYGNYTLSAYCEPNGINEAANNFTYANIVKVTILGDISGDFKVSLSDLVLLANAYGSHPNDAKWNVNADINGNSKVDLPDLVLLALHYGQHYP